MTAIPPTIKDLAALYHDLIVAPDTPRNVELRNEMIDELKRRTAELKEKEQNETQIHAVLQQR